MHEQQRIRVLWEVRHDPFYRSLIRSDVRALKQHRWVVYWRLQEVPHAMARAHFAWATKKKKWRLWTPE